MKEIWSKRAESKLTCYTPGSFVRKRTNKIERQVNKVKSEDFD